MYYAIICEDQKDSLHKRASSRTAHIKRLDELSKQGRILIAGPHPAIDGENPGAAGFIGFHTSKQLLESGYNVIGLDNLNDYYDINLILYK